MKTQIVKDVPIGVLLIVLYFWCITLVNYLVDWPGFWKLAGIYFLCIMAHKFLNVGFDVIKGIEIAAKNDKK